jgi:hypothetical protein
MVASYVQKSKFDLKDNVIFGHATKNSYKIDKIWVTPSPAKIKEKVLWAKNNSIKNRSWKF